MKSLHKLIAKDIFGCLNQEESMRLEEWRRRNNISDQDYLLIKAEIADPRLHERLVGKSRQIRPAYRTVLRYAAIFLIPLACALALLIPARESTELQEVHSVMHSAPEPREPQLILADGQVRTISRENALQVVTPNIVTTGDALVCGQSEESPATSAAAMEYNTIVVPQAGEFHLTLADGTRIWLNEKTRLSFPVGFPGDTREITLAEGEIYLEVTRIPGQPFIVHTVNGAVRVLGTHFNIRTDSDQRVTTTLAEGSVEVSAGEQKVVLVPGQQAVAGNGIETAMVDVDEVICWKNNLFYFKDQPLAAILEKLSGWYGFSVSWENPSFRDIKYFIYVDKYSSVDEILEKLTEVSDVRFRIQGNTVCVCK